MGHVFFQTLSFSGGSRFPPPWSLFLSSCPSSFSSSFVAPTFFPSFHHVTGAAQPSLPVCVIHSPILLGTHLTFPLLTIWSSLSILRKGVSGAPWIPKASDTHLEIPNPHGWRRKRKSSRGSEPLNSHSERGCRGCLPYGNMSPQPQPMDDA